MSTTTATAPTVSIPFAAIAAALPGEWAVKPYRYEHFTEETRGYIVREDGLTIYAVANEYGNRGKVAFRHSRPTGKDGRFVELWEPGRIGSIDSPSINCTLTKTGEQMAADIARRLLPEAERIEPLARAKVAEYENAENAQAETLRLLSEATGDKNPHRSSVYFKGPNGNGSAEIRGGDCVCVEMRSLTRAQALALVEWIKGNV